MSSDPSVPPVRWRFGQFEADLSAGELRKNGLRIRIQEQPARILGALLERPGELITREELRERLWPGDTFVDFERSLNAAVAKLRQVLADSAEHPRFVETVARRGYRLIAPVAIIPPAPEAARLNSDSIAVETGSSTLRRKPRQLLWPAALIALVLVSGGLYVSRRQAGSREAPVLRFTVSPPEGTRIHPVSAVSPDGRKVAFVPIDSAGRRTLWVRTLATDAAVRLENTDGALAPFFSPDSHDIGFFAEGKLKRIPAVGGSPQTLCDQSHAAGGTWNRDGVILFSQAGRLYRISAGGGSATALEHLVTVPGQTIVDTWPQFLPDGQNFLVRSRVYTGHLNPARSEILLGSLKSGKRQFLLASRNQAAITSSGYLFFVRNGTLLAQKLDVPRFQLVGEQLAVAEDVSMGNEGIEVEIGAGMVSAMGPAAFSVSNNGVMIYHSITPQRSQLVWFDRNGKRLAAVGESREYTQVFLSPDERWAAVGIRNRERTGVSDQTLWLMELATNVLSRLSYGDGQDADPVWSPDSSRIVYGAYESAKGENIDLMEVKLGERTARVFYADGRANKPEAWSPDGRFLIFRRDEQAVFTLPALGDRVPAVLLDSPYMRSRFQFSPDGRWLAYMSFESGRAEIYVSRFPEMTGTRQVSTDGGWTPAWRKDGKELFYMTESGQLMAMDIKPGLILETGRPKLLFHPDIRSRSSNMGQFGVAANGQKFLVNEALHSQNANAQMHVVSQWNAPRGR
jgi:eukaryotic-like serine/threonine-protein kinase